EDGAIVVDARPVERRVPSAGLNRVPTIAEPQLRAPIASILDELKIFAAGDQALGHAVRVEPDAVTGQLVVKAEAVAGVACLLHAAFKAQELEGLGAVRRCRGWSVRKIGGAQRVGIEGEDVGDEEFLVLLLVIYAQLD